MRERGALSQEIEIPSLEVFKSFGAARGFDPDRVQKCFRHYETSGWRDAQGKPVQNWKAKLSSWMNRPEIPAHGSHKRDDTAARREYRSTIRPRIE